LTTLYKALPKPRIVCFVVTQDEPESYKQVSDALTAHLKTVE